MGVFAVATPKPIKKDEPKPKQKPQPKPEQTILKLDDPINMNSDQKIDEINNGIDKNQNDQDGFDEFLNDLSKGTRSISPKSPTPKSTKSNDDDDDDEAAKKRRKEEKRRRRKERKEKKKEKKKKKKHKKKKHKKKDNDTDNDIVEMNDSDSDDIVEIE